MNHKKKRENTFSKLEKIPHHTPPEHRTYIPNAEEIDIVNTAEQIEAFRYAEAMTENSPMVLYNEKEAAVICQRDAFLEEHKQAEGFTGEAAFIRKGDSIRNGKIYPTPMIVWDPGTLAPYIDVLEPADTVPVSHMMPAPAPATALPQPQAPQFYPVDSLHHEEDVGNRYLPSRRQGETREDDNHYTLAQMLLHRVPLKKVNDVVFRFTGRIYEELSENALDSLIVELLRDKLSKSGRSGTLKGIANFIKAEPSIEARPVAFDCFLCFKNGVLDLRSNRLKPHSPDLFFTSYIDVDYLPNFEGKARSFNAYLASVTGNDPVLIRRFKEAIGYILMPDNNGKCFFLMQGVPNSGKTQLGLLLERLFNRGAVSNLDIFRFGDRFALSSLARVRLNLSMDLPDRPLKAEAVAAIKMITGNDMVTLERKFRDVDFARLNCKLLFSSNHPLRLTQYDEAFSNRVVLLPFQYSIPERNRKYRLQELFESEKAAIVQEALCAYWELKSNSYIFSGADKYQYRQELAFSTVASLNVGLEAFLRARCVPGTEDSFVPTSRLFDEYVKFCCAEGFAQYPDRNAFSRAFNQVCSYARLTKKRIGDSTHNGYKSIALTSNGG